MGLLTRFAPGKALVAKGNHNMVVHFVAARTSSFLIFKTPHQEMKRGKFRFHFPNWENIFPARSEVREGLCRGAAIVA